MFHRFHSFSDHLPLQLMREDDDGLHDGERVVIGAEPPHKRLIDLEERNRQLMKIAQGRIAGAEIVQAGLYLLRGELFQYCCDRFRVLHHVRFGHFDLETRRIDAGGPYNLIDERGQIGVREMAERKIHAHGQRTNLRKLRVPHSQLPAGLSEAPRADLREKTPDLFYPFTRLDPGCRCNTMY
jgi:hypothetical protein